MKISIIFIIIMVMHDDNDHDDHDDNVQVRKEGGTVCDGEQVGQAASHWVGSYT